MAARARLMLALLLCAAPAAAATIRSIEIQGLRYSREALVRRELPFAPGDAWRPELAGQARKRLMALGVFSEVHVLPPDAHGVVRIVVRDRWPLWILPTATRKDTGESWVGIALRHYNVAGLAHEALVEVRNFTGRNFSSWRRVRDARLDYYWRRMRGGDLSLRLDAAAATAPGERTHTLGIALERALGETPELGPLARLGLFRVHRTGARAFLAQGLDAAFVWNDVFEHVDWQEGARVQLRLLSAPRWGGADTRWHEVSGLWARYLALDARGDTLNARLAFAARDGDLARIGLLDPSGGRGLRGHYPGEVPARAWVLASIEPRWRVPGAENVQLVVFADLAWAGHGRWRAWPAFGGGARWTLRWLAHGTLRLDLGYGLRTRRWRVHLGAGQAF